MSDALEIVVAADTSYATPLAVTLRSIDRHLSCTGRVHALDLGMTPRDRLDVREAAGDLELSWIAVDESMVRGLPFTGP